MVFNESPQFSMQYLLFFTTAPFGAYAPVSPGGGNILWCLQLCPAPLRGKDVTTRRAARVAAGVTERGLF